MTLAGRRPRLLGAIGRSGAVRVVGRRGYTQGHRAMGTAAGAPQQAVLYHSLGSPPSSARFSGDAPWAVRGLASTHPPARARMIPFRRLSRPRRPRLTHAIRKSHLGLYSLRSETAGPLSLLVYVGKTSPAWEGPLRVFYAQYNFAKINRNKLHFLFFFLISLSGYAV